MFTTLRATCIVRAQKSDLMTVVQRGGPAGLAFLRDPPPVWPLLAGSRAGRSGQNGVATHTQLLGGRTVNIIFCTSRSNDYVAKQDGVIFPC